MLLCCWGFRLVCFDQFRFGALAHKPTCIMSSSGTLHSHWHNTRRLGGHVHAKAAGPARGRGLPQHCSCLVPERVVVRARGLAQSLSKTGRTNERVRTQRVQGADITQHRKGQPVLGPTHSQQDSSRRRRSTRSRSPRRRSRPHGSRRESLDGVSVSSADETVHIADARSRSPPPRIRGSASHHTQPPKARTRSALGTPAALI